MAAALSDDEFHRMQLQLIELRTQKYELESVTKKQEREIQCLKEVAEVTDKELQKAQKAVSKSKKAKEVELLLQENDGLQMRLQSQEDDFRLQNQALMQELSLLVSSNEELEKKVAETGEAANQSTPQSAQLEDELRRLQAQNSALQKTVSSLQSSKSSTPESDVPDGDVEETNTPLQQSSGTEPCDVESLQKSVDDLKLNLATECEEKSMLKQELLQKEEKHSKEMKSFTEEMEKLTEKLKKKHESFLQLQQEKETSYKDICGKLDEVQASKDRDQKYYTDQITKLQQEIAKYHTLQEDQESSSAATIKQLQTKMAQMQQQIDAADIIENQHVQERSNKYQTHINELKSQVLLLTQKKDELSAQLQDSRKSAEDVRQKLDSVQKDCDAQILAAQQANKLAEKRKVHLDELSIKYQTDCDKQRELSLSQENEYDAKLKSVQHRLDQEQKRGNELEKLKPVVEEQQTTIASLEEKTGWLERQLADTEGSLDKTLDENQVAMVSMKTEHEDEVAALNTQHSTHIQQLTDTFQADITILKQTEESQTQTIETLETDVKKLRQDIKDGLNERKVHEKKGKSVLKDLKKQLHAERSRGDKLQERLQEVLSSGSHNKSIEDLFRSPDRGEWREDQSSISSWSGVGTLASYTNSHTSHGALSVSGQGSPLSPTSELPASSSIETTTLESDNRQLMSQLAIIQEDKWNLEEKVRHLETSTAAMANDLIEKSRIIEHYVMERRTDKKQPHAPPVDDKITLKKVLDMVNKSDDQGLREMNKKLQNMLEETLTKNMHLQKDLETMSQELVRLSKFTHQMPDSASKNKDITNSHQDTQHTTDKCSSANGAVL